LSSAGESGKQLNPVAQPLTRATGFHTLCLLVLSLAQLEESYYTLPFAALITANALLTGLVTRALLTA
jgi:hypothetical protein